MYRHFVLLGRIAQPIQKDKEIIGATKNMLPVGTELDYMMRLLGNNQSWKARHNEKRKRCNALDYNI